MKGHEHKYIAGTIGDECSFCGLLKSTIESINKPDGFHPDPNGDLKFIYKKARELVEEIERVLKNKEI